MIRLAAVCAVLLLVALAPLPGNSTSSVYVGSKAFTESVILGEMLTLLTRDAEVQAVHYRQLGGTKLVFQALLNGDIDVYPEYTGTIAQEILSQPEVLTIEQLRSELQQRYSVRISAPLGFNNTYALGMQRSQAAELGISTVSDLRRHPELVFGFSNEFMDRQDGWQGLQNHYQLPQQQVRGLDHDLAYRQLRLGAIDVIDVYTTDSKIEGYDLIVLEDDLQYFPEYQAVLLYSEQLADKYPEVVRSLQRLEGSLSAAAMTAANSRVELDRVSETQVAAEILQQKFDVVAEIPQSTRTSRILTRTVEHLDLVRRSLIPAILIAVPLGVMAARRPRFGQFILATVGIVQTIPALALLVLLMPLVAAVGLASVGLSSTTAIVALLLYSLLPIVRNTHSGLQTVATEYRESAAALGLPAGYQLVKIELPLASRNILAGIKTAAVMNIGFATLGAFLGAGGYGQPIITGIRLNDLALTLEGAIPAALLALLVQALFDIAEVWLVPAGLR